MNAGATQPHGWMPIVVPLAIFAVIMAIRAPRLMQRRPLHVDRLWIVPLIFLVFPVLVFVRTPPTPLGWALAALGLAVGAGLGWQRGKLMRIDYDAATGTLMQKGSIWALVFIAILFALRLLTQNEGTALGGGIALLVLDGLAPLSFGMFTVQRIEMYLRATKLLATTRGAQA